MKLEFDTEKDAENIRKHGLSLADVGRFDLAAAVVVPDDREDYGEARFRAYGFMAGRMYMLAFTMRGKAVRAISFRKANQREVDRYDSR